MYGMDLPQENLGHRPVAAVQEEGHTLHTRHQVHRGMTGQVRQVVAQGEAHIRLGVSHTLHAHDQGLQGTRGQHLDLRGTRELCRGTMAAGRNKTAHRTVYIQRAAGWEVHLKAGYGMMQSQGRTASTRRMACTMTLIQGRKGEGQREAHKKG